MQDKVKYFFVLPGAAFLSALLFYGMVLCTSGIPLGHESLGAVMSQARQGRLAQAVMDDDSSMLSVEYRTDVMHRPHWVLAAVPTSFQGQAVSELLAAGVDVTVAKPGDGSASAAVPEPQELGNTALVLSTFGLAFLFILASAVASVWAENRDKARSGASGAGSRSQSAASNGVDKNGVPTTRFADVAGCDEAIADLSEIVKALEDPDKYAKMGVTVPKGALLTGPPGTGKTMLARAVAGEAGVPFYAVAGSDFVEMYVGVGAKRIRSLFAKARKHPRAIIFIDEIDAVARRRSEADVSGGGIESENTLIALLAEMDGFDKSGVVVLAATNRPDILDPAITRPGRLDRKVEVPNPDRRGREAILAVHVKARGVEAQVDLTALARRTPGFSGAQLQALVNEACMEAVRRDLTFVTQDCFDNAVATIAMGRARTSALVTEADREVTAWHEAGHTLAAYLQADADDPVQVTIVPRGPAGGVTWMSGNDDQFLPRRKAHAQLVTAMAGRAGEEALLGGEYTQGAAGDLESATDLAYKMATRYGMTRLGYQVRPGRPGSDPAVVEVVEELLADAHVAATQLLGEHRALLEAVAEELLEEETLTLTQIEEIAARLGVARTATVEVPAPPVSVRPERLVGVRRPGGVDQGHGRDRSGGPRPRLAPVGVGTSRRPSRTLAAAAALAATRQRRQPAR